jgi:hypothetical protein
LAGQKLAVSKFHGEVALAAERKAADTDERAEGILVFSGESEGITEDDADACGAHGEAEWPRRPSQELSMGCSTVAPSEPVDFLTNEQWSPLGDN